MNVIITITDDVFTRLFDNGVNVSEEDKKELFSAIRRGKPTPDYEYHIDHTDCIWYNDDATNCPTTCSQYRDGWNDAMQYIFKNGDGYRPYCR